MPTYEYICRKCSHSFERFQSITAEPIAVCPNEKCGSKHQVERLLGTGGGILFKGSGFYKTDYRSRGYKEAKDNDQKPTCESNKKCDKGKCCE